MSRHSDRTNDKSRQVKMLQSVEKFMPEYFIKCHESVLYKIKLIDLYSFYEDFESDQKQICFPILTKPLLKNPRFFSQQLSKCIKSLITPMSPKQLAPPFVKCVFRFFSENGPKCKNENCLDYFIRCFFPTIFCNFSSEDFISLGYKFIVSYSKIENKYQDNDIVSKLKSKNLIPIFILHNFHFQVECFDTFYRLVFQNQNNDHSSILIALLNSFENNLRFLHYRQLQFLVNLARDNTAITSFMEILEDILIKMISLCSYSPGFCATGILSDDFISYTRDAIKNFEQKSKNQVNRAINQLIHTIKKKVQPQNSINSDHSGLFDIMNNPKVLLSDYDVILFSRILQEGGELSIDGANMNREYTNPSEFFTPFSTFRIFYIDVNFDINLNSDQINSYSKQKRAMKDSNTQTRYNRGSSFLKQSFLQTSEMRPNFSHQPGIRFDDKKTELLQKVGSLSFMKTQKKASKMILKMVMLKYSDKNYFYGDINTSDSMETFADSLIKFLADQNKLISPDLKPDIMNRESSLYNKLLAQYCLNQCIIYLNKNELNVEQDKISISTDKNITESKFPFDFYFNNFIAIVNFRSDVNGSIGFKYVAFGYLLPPIMSLNKSHNDIANLISKEDEKNKFFDNFINVFSALKLIIPQIPKCFSDFPNNLQTIVTQDATNINQFIESGEYQIQNS